MSTNARAGIAYTLNRHCHCVIVDEAELAAALAQPDGTLRTEDLQRTHPHLFSRTGVFIDADNLAAMGRVVEAIERVVSLPGYRRHALAQAPPHAQIETRALGAFLGYDFHLSDVGPQLIEINTNPGGALLSAALRQAQRACCEEVAQALKLTQPDPARSFIDMFRAEHALARGDAVLRRVALVDDDPPSQYLFPEFVLFKRLFEAHGIAAEIADPAQLRIESGRLMLRDQPIDLVYNRLTDFALGAREHAVLGEALRSDLAVITPHPRAHALYADKQRLVTLSNPAPLREFGATEVDIAVLERHVPRTVLVEEAAREQLWSERKKLFFKPQSGFGSRAAYRGDKITKAVFGSVFTTPYVAQALVPPSSRSICLGEEKRELKLDVRNYAYAGRTQLVAARLDQGQTTNFRTEGGGFAPVYETAT